MKKLYYALITLSIIGTTTLEAQVQIDPPLSYFDFEGTGTTLTDGGSAANNGEIISGDADGPVRATGGIYTEDGDGKGCIEMKGGAGSHLEVPYNSYLDSPSYTIAMWIKYTVNTAWDGYLLYNEGETFPDGETIPTERHIDVWTWGNGAETTDKYGWISQNDITGADEPVKSWATADAFGSDYLADGEWHLFTITLDEGTTMKIYCDAKLLIETEFDSEVVISEKEAALWIGGRAPLTKNTLQAFIDKVRIWNSALTAEQITALFAYEGDEGGDANAATFEVESSIETQVKKHISLKTFPNPSVGTTTISFTLDNTSEVSISILDMLGKEVSIVANKVYGAGMHQISFEASELATGLYVLQLETEQESAVETIVVK